MAKGIFGQEKVIDAVGAGEASPIEGAEVPGTEEETKKAAEKEAKKTARKEAKQKIREFLKEEKNKDFSLFAELLLVVGAERKASGSREKSINTLLKKALINAASKGMTEIEIFKEFKIGRPEMALKMKLYLKVKDAKDRVWITFDEKTETYFVVATGAEMPKEWKGYKPATENIL